MKKAIFTALATLALTLGVTACTTDTPTPIATTQPPVTTTAPTTTAPDTTPAIEAPPALRPTVDRAGNPITLPDEINTIVTLGPSKAEILVALGFGSHIIATDSFAADVEGLAPGTARAFGITDPDPEYILDLMPDVIFLAGVAAIYGDTPLAPLAAAGITIVSMPTSTSIAGIIEDIRFMAAVMGTPHAGDEMIATMEAELAAVEAIAATIGTNPTVYFEISPAPWMFSFGQGTFLQEMLEILHVVNVFENEEGWIPVTDEALLALNPDFILTTTDFIDDPVGEIMSRPGFETITAVEMGHVFTIDTASSNRPTHNITRALWEMARAIYPEYFPS